MKEGNFRLALTRRIVHTIYLLQSGEPIFKAELMRAFDVDPKTIQRLMNVLAEFYPIRKERVGREVCFTLETKNEKRDHHKRGRRN
jgi:predicted DNA-binding transcriptional regulator YafY